MCGIYGMVSLDGSPLAHPEALARMGETLIHRGPDGSGSVALPHAAMGANRLRIVDRHPRGDQPFADEGRCTWLALNGEIYNSSELRSRFPRFSYRSQSDAEVVLPLYAERGAEGIADLEGMFAIAVWDEGSRRLLLARDRAGEKPLFWARVGQEIWFASEVQALLEYPGLGRDLDLEALDDFLAFGYVREPRTMFAGIGKVEAGTVLVFEQRCAVRGVGFAELAEHEEASRTAHRAPRTDLALGDLVESAVRKQLVADVPVGVFLSGGLDSSLITSIAARETPIRTFTVRFSQASYDEGQAARRVAQHVGTQHTEVMADDDALRTAFHTVTSRVAEPIADPAILPTFLLAARARQDVGVVLGGEGADELFGGYPAYVGHRLARWIPGWLSPLASLLPSSSGRVPISFLLQRLLAHAGKPWLERHVAWMGTGLTGARFAVRGSRSVEITESRTPHTAHRAPATDILSQAMRFDYATYLRDGLLPKIDRATMLVSLEARAPYLDRQVTNFALGQPGSMNVRGLTTKWLLKQAATRWLPPDVINRRKQGLSVPISRLINDTLRTEVDRLLAPGLLQRQGLLNPQTAGQLLSEHRAGNYRVARGIWALVILQRWMEEWS